VEPFISTDDLNAVLGQTVTPTDLIVSIALDSACESVRSYLGQTINLVTGDVTELDGNGRLAIRLPQRPVRALTSVFVDDMEVVADDYSLRGALLRRKDGGGFTVGFGNVIVTYDHGYDIVELPSDFAVPADIRLVALLAARRVYTTVGTAAGAIQSETMGSYSYTLSTTVIASTAAELLKPETDVLDRYRIGKIP
jgi:hypothetical protein